MPICPRCGKSLTTEQALQYHLNKKYKCNSIKCNKCNKTFSTKLELQMHLIHCEEQHPSYDELLKYYLDNSTKLSSCYPVSTKIA